MKRYSAAFGRSAATQGFTFIERESLIIGGATDPDRMKDVGGQPEFQVLVEKFREQNESRN